MMDPRAFRILVAEDDPDILRLVGLSLGRRGFAVVEVADGREALDALRAERPDLAVLDIHMPGLSGLEVVEAAQADPATAHIPLVILSASAQSLEVQLGLARGARAYLTKPFAPAELAATLIGILRPVSGRP